jgi:glycosyltransferase involved in cell wall biosynthesis
MRTDRKGRPGDRATSGLMLVTEFFPWSPQTVFGAVQRLRCHIAALQQIGALDVVFFWPTGSVPTAEEEAFWQKKARAAWGLDGRVFLIPVDLPRTPLDRLRDLAWACRGAVGFFRLQPSMRTSGTRQARMLRRCLREAAPDLVFAHRLGAGAALLRTPPAGSPVVLDVDDIEHVRIDRLAQDSDRPARRLQLRLWGFAARFAERRIVRASACALVCSELDRAKLLAVTPAANIAVLPNTARDPGDLPPAEAPVALFVGIASYGPNRDAVLWLANEIWPRVLSLVPAAQLLIAGEDTERLPLPADVPGIGVLGFMHDLEGLYRDARLVVCPVRSGGGTRIKIIEAALSGRAIVSTVIGAEGLAFEPGSEILLADGADEFARLCATVLVDQRRAADLGRAARSRALGTYSQDSVRTALVSLLRQTLQPA